MTVLNAVFLGLLQAAGEFLPVSSSAHLALFPFLTGGEYQGLTYDVALHLATLIAVVCYFWKDILKLAKAGLTAPKTDDGRLFWYIGIATVPAALFGYFFEDAAEHAFRNPLMIAFMLIVFACLLMWADRLSSKKTVKKEVFTFLPMLAIGFAQALALMPGVSRSGVTITAALFLGYGRAASAKVSFFLSMPIIAGAAALKLKDVSPADIDTAFAAGFLAAAIGGWLVIKFLMSYIQKHSFDVFVYYRWALGALIIFLYFWKGV